MNKYLRYGRNILIAVAVGALVMFVLNTNKAKREAAVEKMDPNVAVPVTVTGVKKEVLQSTLSIVGTVIPNNDVMLLSETAGRITEMYVDVGSILQRGTLMLKVDDELRRAAFLTAEAAFEQAKRDVERYTTLYEQKSITSAQVEGARLQLKNAEANYIVAKRNLADTEVRSPIAGTLTSRLVNVGATLGPGSPIGNIVDVSVLKVLVNVPENDVFKLRPGQRVEVTTDVFPDAKYTGVIANISAKADEAHTYGVQVQIQNNGAYPLKAGMFARVNFTSITPSQSLIIPRVALLGSVKDAKVYVAEGGKAVLRPIVVGATADQRIEVLQGLNETDIIIVDGQINLQDGAPISINKR
jgi:RND family efflux transporter MFP subunit